MVIPVMLALCFSAAPPSAERPAEAFVRLRKEAFASSEVRDKSGPRFSAHARRHPDHPSAIEALLLAADVSYDAGDGVREQALKRLEDHYARSPLVVPLLRNLGLDWGETASTFLRQVGDTNPDKRVRALAWRAVINGRSSYIRKRQEYLSDESEVKRLTANYLKQAKAELAKWKKEIDLARTKLKSPDLVGALADVSVGAKAPPTEAVDLDGRTVSLTDHRGKVVVLDFWYTRCGPCRRTVPCANALIEEMKGRPFVQIGVSVDPDRETVSAYLKTTAMPWEHWWVGRRSKALEAWDVEAYPTVYVIAHEGVIRHHQVGFDPAKCDLYDLIRALVKKAEAAK